MVTGYKESDLLDAKLPVLIPKGISDIHDKFVTKFLEDKKVINTITDISDFMVRNKDDTISMVKTSVKPQITEDYELIVIAIIEPTLTYHIFEKDMPIDEVFFILTDENDKLLHFSVNCLTQLNFSHSQL